MNPSFHPHLINDPFGDPGVYVGFSFKRRALLFDLGDLAPLPARKLLDVTHVFVSHTHMDHFAGFDRLLRLLVGREKHLALFGPVGFIDQLEAKLRAYTWNLAPDFKAELRLTATEICDPVMGTRAEFRLRERFARRDHGATPLVPGIAMEEPGLRVRFTILDHGIPCLAFALEEARHVNIWRSEVEAMGLAMGAWLGTLKAAVHRDAPDPTPIPVQWKDGSAATELPLGQLRDRLISITPGQRIAYVTDAAPHGANFDAIVQLVAGADILFMEAGFLHADAATASTRNHLTARQAGELARQAGVQTLVPFHFSPRYSSQGALLHEEAMAAFQGPAQGAVSVPWTP